MRCTFQVYTCTRMSVRCKLCFVEGKWQFFTKSYHSFTSLISPITIVFKIVGNIHVVLNSIQL